MSLEKLKERNEERVSKENRDDWGKWLEGMVRYQREIRDKGLVDKVINADRPVEEISKELLDYLLRSA